jgi:cytochrome b561
MSAVIERAPLAPGYGSVAKLPHWLIAAILVAQFALGLWMPNIRRGMEPGEPMHLHISIGIVVLVLIVVRLAWRVAHPVQPESALPRWQHYASEVLHWLLYLLVLGSTLSGWFYASMRGWPLSFFELFPLPALVPEGSTVGRSIGRVHESIVWVLAAAVALHVLAALAHAFIWKDGVMRRMLP